MTFEFPRRTRPFPVLSPLAAVLAIALIGGFGVFGALHIDLETDITALLPRDEGDASFTELARAAGLMRKVVVLIGPCRDDEELHAFIDRAGEALAKIEGASEVVWRVDPSAVLKSAEAIMSGSPRLYRSDISGPLEEIDVDARLADLKRRLAAPEAMIMQQFLLADPLGFGRDALRGLEAAGEAMGARVDRGHLLSEDGRFGLILIDTNFDPFRIDEAASFVARLDTRLSRLGSEKEIARFAIGGPHFAASSAQVIMRDVQRAFVLTSLGIVAVFLLVFRRLRFLPAALLPGGLGIACGVGVMALLGERVHALTLGFSATVTGISVDYAIHLLHRASFERASERGGTTRQAIEKALAAVSTPVVLGCVTTVAAFIIVASSSFVGIRQLALFASISVPVALLATLFLLPAFHGVLLSGEHHEGIGGRVLRRVLDGMEETGAGSRGWGAMVFFAGLVALCAAALFGLELSGDPQSLGYTDPDLQRRMETLERVFPGLAEQAIVVATGSDIDAALDANDELYAALLAGGFERGEVVSISPFHPGPAVQRRSVAEVRTLLENPRVDARFAAAGFRESFKGQLLAGTIAAAPIRRETYEGSSLQQMTDDALREYAGRQHVLTRLRSADEATLGKLEAIAARLPFVRLVSSRLDARRALVALQAELLWMVGIWLAGAVLTLAIVRRSIGFGVRAALPAVIGVLGSLGLFFVLGRPLTPVASAGLTLVLGLGIDYGIFVQQREGGRFGAIGTAVAASAFTTIAGFGVLSVSSVRAMADLGLIALCGVACAMAASILLVPKLERMGARKER